MNSRAKDIAKNLNISTATVSLALNNRPGVSPRTRSMVLAEAERLNYTKYKEKHLSHVSPDDQIIRNICFVIFQDKGNVIHDTSFYSLVMHGIQSRANDLGYNVIVSFFYANKSWEEQFAKFPKGNSGFIILGTEINESHIRRAIECGILSFDVPLVIADNCFNSLNIDSVCSDNYWGVYYAVEHLISLGHTGIGYVKSKSPTKNYDSRYNGYLYALKKNGIDNIPEPIMSDTNADKAFADCNAWLDRDTRPCTAYFAENDIIAGSFIKALKGRGFRVPEDVAVIGYDDMPICEMIDPPLSSVHIMKESIGSTAMSILHNRITQGGFNLSDLRDGAIHATVSSSLALREST